MSTNQVFLLFLASLSATAFCWDNYRSNDYATLHEGGLGQIPNGRHAIAKRSCCGFGDAISGAISKVSEGVKNTVHNVEAEVNKVAEVIGNVGENAVKEVVSPAMKAMDDIKNRFKDIPEVVKVLQDEEVKKLLTTIIQTFSENGQLLEQLKSVAQLMEENKEAKAVIQEIIKFLSSEDNAAKEIITELINTIPGGASTNAVITTLVNLASEDSKLIELIKQLAEILTRGDEASQVFKKVIDLISKNPAALKLVKDLLSILPAGGSAATVVENLIKTLSKPEMLKVFEQLLAILTSGDDKGEVIKKLIFSADSDLLKNIKTAIGI